jgi:hypothetical protein
MKRNPKQTKENEACRPSDCDESCYKAKAQSIQPVIAPVNHLKTWLVQAMLCDKRFFDSTHYHKVQRLNELVQLQLEIRARP